MCDGPSSPVCGSAGTARLLNGHGRLLNGHGRLLNAHARLLNRHGRLLNEIRKARIIDCRSHALGGTVSPLTHDLRTTALPRPAHDDRRR